MLRRLRDQALVLERRELGESDRLVILLCRQQGKISAVAPAGRASRRRFGGCLELFSHIDVQVVDKGRGGLWRLEEASLIDAHPAIRTDLIAIAHAGYATELVAAILREGDAGSDLFRLLVATLERLTKGPLEVVELRRFELSVLSLAGFAPRLDGCAACGVREADNWRFDLDQGGLVCPGCRAGERSVAISSHVFHFLSDLQSSPASNASMETLVETRRLFARLIDEQVGKPLKSRDFLRQLALDHRAGNTD